MDKQHQNYCQEHSGVIHAIRCLETQLKKLDNRLWIIMVLLLSNLAGVVGLFISYNLHP